MTVHERSEADLPMPGEKNSDQELFFSRGWSAYLAGPMQCGQSIAVRPSGEIAVELIEIGPPTTGKKLIGAGYALNLNTPKR
jgi:hypothetical protein